jgi:hypothetical protein
MADNREVRHATPDLADPNQRFEHRDVNIWAIGKVGFGLILTTILSLFIVLGVFRYLQEKENALQPPPSTLGVDARRLPPEPRLLENEPENLQRTRAAEDQILNGYSWADQKHTVVKIPIDKAIDMLVQKGLPSRPQAPAAASTASVPAESGLGAVMQKPGGPLADQLAEGQSK